MSSEPIGLIVGTGMAEMMPLAQIKPQKLDTSAGTVSCLEGWIGEQRVILLKRHGDGHKVPPHRINYAANILALKELGVSRCFSTSAVGSLREDWNSGTIAILSDFIDFTRRGGVTTLFHETIQHTDFSEPFCPALRSVLIEQAEKLGQPPKPEAVYLCADGPRYETPAEIRLYRQWGADVVGMTVASEAILAREAKICYATVAVITNLGTGLSKERLTHQEVESAMEAAKQFLANLFVQVLSVLPEQNPCN